MAVSTLDDKAVLPNDDLVAGVLASAYPLWNDVCAHTAQGYLNVSGEWKHYGKASGWSYVIKSKKRTLVYLVPCNGYIRIRLVFGEKAAECVYASDVSNDIKDALRSATPYVEGRSIDIDVQHADQLDTIKTLLRIKYEN